MWVPNLQLEEYILLIGIRNSDLQTPTMWPELKLFFFQWHGLMRRPMEWRTTMQYASCMETRKLSLQLKVLAVSSPLWIYRVSHVGCTAHPNIIPIFSQDLEVAPAAIAVLRGAVRARDIFSGRNNAKCLPHRRSDMQDTSPTFEAYDESITMECVRKKYQC